MIGLKKYCISGAKGVGIPASRLPCLHNRRTHSSPHPPAMEQPKQTKEKVREYLERRQVERRQNARAPLHDPQLIRQEIGWDLVERRKSDRRR